MSKNTHNKDVTLTPYLTPIVITIVGVMASFFIFVLNVSMNEQQKAEQFEKTAN